jgi:hypothetical protein
MHAAVIIAAHELGKLMLTSVPHDGVAIAAAHASASLAVA